MTTSAAGQNITFSNDDAKANICSKAQLSMNSLTALVKAIVKNSHTNDYLGTTLRQFSNMDQQLTSTSDRIAKIEELTRQLNRQSEIIRNGTNELEQIEKIFLQMKLGDS